MPASTSARLDTVGLGLMETDLAVVQFVGPLSGSDGRSLESVTPLSMEVEWDLYVRRKQHGAGLQPIVVRVACNENEPFVCVR